MTSSCFPVATLCVRGLSSGPVLDFEPTLMSLLAVLLSSSPLPTSSFVPLLFPSLHLVPLWRLLRCVPSARGWVVRGCLATVLLRTRPEEKRTWPPSSALCSSSSTTVSASGPFSASFTVASSRAALRLPLLFKSRSVGFGGQQSHCRNKWRSRHGQFSETDCVNSIPPCLHSQLTPRFTYSHLELSCHCLGS